MEIKRQLHDDQLSQSLITKLQNLVTEKYPNHNTNLSVDHVRNVLNWATSRITRIEDLVTKKFGFLWILPTNIKEVDKDLLKKLAENLESIEIYEEDEIKDYLRRFSKDNDVQFSVLMKMLRSVLSGLEEGPSVSEMMNLLGKSQSLERIKSVLR